MSPPVDTPMPSSPDVTWQTLMYTLIRSVLMVTGMLGVTAPSWANASSLWTLAGALVVLGTSIWSLVQKVMAQRAAHENAVVSANVGAAVKVS